VSQSASGFSYFVVITPEPSADDIRRAAKAGCPGDPAASAEEQHGSKPGAVQEAPEIVGVAIAPGEGERISYCVFPLTIT
jgi:hypothetical protein